MTESKNFPDSDFNDLKDFHKNYLENDKSFVFEAAKPRDVKELILDKLTAKTSLTKCEMSILEANIAEFENKSFSKLLSKEEFDESFKVTNAKPESDQKNTKPDFKILEPHKSIDSILNSKMSKDEKISLLGEKSELNDTLDEFLISYKLLKPIPLINFLKTCYANSAFQAMILPFYDLISNLIDSSNLTLDLLETAPVLYTIFKFIDSTVRSKPFVIAQEILKFKDKIKYINPMFNLNDFQDCSEFLSGVFDRIDKELEQLNTKTELPWSFIIDDRYFCSTCRQSNAKEPENKGNILFMEFERSLEDMFNITFVNTINEYNCDHCHQINPTTKSSEFSEISKYVIIAINRHQYDATTNSYVKNRTCLSLEQSIGIALKDDNRVNYHLISLVNHFGSLNNGHYNAYVLINGDWFLADDEHVRIVEFAEISKNQDLSEVSLLLYQSDLID